MPIVVLSFYFILPLQEELNKANREILKRKEFKKEQEKVEKYQPLAQYYRVNYKTFQTRIIPVVVGAFGIIPANLPNNLDKLGIPDVVGGLQLTALLGTRRILKNTLSLR